MTKTLIIGLVLAGTAFTLSAQPGPGCRAGGPNRNGSQGLQPPVAAVLDANADGVLSANEITQAPTQLLALDKNQDGQLSAEELCGGGPGSGSANCPFGNQAQRGGGKRQGQGQGRGLCSQGQNPVFLRLLDADGDGLLSGVEINNSPAILRNLDANLDGQLTGDELRPRTGCGQGRGWGCQRQS